MLQSGVNPKKWIPRSVPVPASHAYRQVAGRTNFTGGGITGNVEISGGELLAVEGLNQANSGLQTPTISGNLTVGNALIDPIALKVNGSVLLADRSRVLIPIAT